MVYAPCLSTMQRWFRSTKKVKHEPTTNTASTLTTTLITPSPGTIATERKLLYLLAIPCLHCWKRIWKLLVDLSILRLILERTNSSLYVNFVYLWKKFLR
uniref:Candidate secreted effector n=1 Tax=Meloidogyne incognita TaxID=6306 RepID=A0A914L3M6_MELIC